MTTECDRYKAWLAGEEDVCRYRLLLSLLWPVRAADQQTLAVNTHVETSTCDRGLFGCLRGMRATMGNKIGLAPLHGELPCATDFRDADDADRPPSWPGRSWVVLALRLTRVAGGDVR